MVATSRLDDARPVVVSTAPRRFFLPNSEPSRVCSDVLGRSFLTEGEVDTREVFPGRNGDPLARTAELVGETIPRNRLIAVAANEADGGDQCHARHKRAANTKHAREHRTSETGAHGTSGGGMSALEKALARHGHETP